MGPQTKEILNLIEQNTENLQKAIKQRYSSEIHAYAISDIASEPVKYTPNLQRLIKREFSKESENFKKNDKLVALLIEHYVISARDN